MQKDDEVDARAPAQSSWRWQALWLVLGSIVAVSVFAIEEAVFSTPPLTFTVGSSEERGVLGDWESAPDDAALPIRFSDGTIVELEPSATARVVAIGRAGAELVIESGRASVDVAPARLRVPGEAPWRVRLGPYVVEAHGTRFEVSWDPHANDFSAEVIEGQLDVSGCGHDPSRRVLAGQGIHKSCEDRERSPVSLVAP
jgi:ferric-dicitrate binding protein FerR (iron transport regulator)